MSSNNINGVNGIFYTCFKIRREMALNELEYTIDENCTKILEDMRK